MAKELDADELKVAVISAMEDVVLCRPDDRERQFEKAYLIINLFLATRCHPQTVTMKGHGSADFLALTRIYLRALDTYPSHRREWLDVFIKFKRLLDDQLKSLPAPSRTAPSSDALLQLQRLHQKGQIVVTENAEDVPAPEQKRRDKVLLRP